jgi:hypothetical protein
MKRLFIYVEGLTEEFFVDRLLRNHLHMFGVKVENALQAKKDFTPDGPRGGFTNWAAMEQDMSDWFAMNPDKPLAPAKFTSLLDLYALPAEVPGFQGRGAATTSADVDALEAVIATRFNEPRFEPYLQRHEFEALLLTDPKALAYIFPYSAAEVAILEANVAGIAPEDINHGRTTHPAARIMSAIPNYYLLKASNAFSVASHIGLDAIRGKCPRFDAWLSRWEQWGMQP